MSSIDLPGIKFKKCGDSDKLDDYLMARYNAEPIIDEDHLVAHLTTIHENSVRMLFATAELFPSGEIIRFILYGHNPEENSLLGVDCIGYNPIMDEWCIKVIYIPSDVYRLGITCEGKRSHYFLEPGNDPDPKKMKDYLILIPKRAH